MRQKLQDLFDLLRQDKKYQVMAVLVVFAMLYLYIAEPTPSRKPIRPIEDKGSKIATKEGFDDLVKAMGNEVSTLKDDNKQIKTTLQELQTSQKSYQTKVGQIFQKVLDRIQDMEQKVTARNASLGPDNLAEVAPEEEEQGLEDFGEKDAPMPPPPAPQPKKIAVIAPGDSVRVKLLAGVNAPTDGTPYPVVFKLLDDVRGPDSSALPLGEARVVAAAQGSLTDSRALFRLTTLNIRLPDGRKKIVDIDGWIVGEDGVRGMEGILLDPLGKAIVGSAEAGFFQGLGQGISDSQIQTEDSVFGFRQVVKGDTLKYASGKGIQTGAKEISAIIKERLSLMVPHVQVYSGREATAVFSKKIDITDLFESLGDDDSNFANSVD